MPWFKFKVERGEEIRTVRVEADTKAKALKVLKRHLANQDQERIIERLHYQGMRSSLQLVFLWGVGVVLIALAAIYVMLRIVF